MKTMTKTFLAVTLLAFTFGMSPVRAHDMNKKTEKVQCDGAKKSGKAEDGKSVKSEAEKTRSRLGDSLTGMGSKRI